jgi:hypothetical protein
MLISVTQEVEIYVKFSSLSCHPIPIYMKEYIYIFGGTGDCTLSLPFAMEALYHFSHARSPL